MRVWDLDDQVETTKEAHGLTFYFYALLGLCIIVLFGFVLFNIHDTIWWYDKYIQFIEVIIIWWVKLLYIQHIL